MLKETACTQDTPLSARTLGRRSFIASAVVGTAAVALGREFGPNAEPIRYPDPDIVTLDPRFAKYKLGNTPIQRLHLGTLWAEGPAWNGVGRYLVWSDIPNDRQLRWLEEDGHVSVFRRPVGNSNGNTFDASQPHLVHYLGHRTDARIFIRNNDDTAFRVLGLGAFDERSIG